MLGAMDGKEYGALHAAAAAAGYAMDAGQYTMLFILVLQVMQKILVLVLSLTAGSKFFLRK